MSVTGALSPAAVEKFVRNIVNGGAPVNNAPPAAGEKETILAIVIET